MELVVMPSAESDLVEIEEKEAVERVLNKFSETEDRLELGVVPGTAVEKRLYGNGSPMLMV